MNVAIHNHKAEYQNFYVKEVYIAFIKHFTNQNEKCYGLEIHIYNKTMKNSKDIIF